MKFLASFSSNHQTNRLDTLQFSSFNNCKVSSLFILVVHHYIFQIHFLLLHFLILIDGRKQTQILLFLQLTDNHSLHDISLPQKCSLANSYLQRLNLPLNAAAINAIKKELGQLLPVSEIGDIGGVLEGIVAGTGPSTITSKVMNLVSIISYTGKAGEGLFRYSRTRDKNIL